MFLVRRAWSPWTRESLSGRSSDGNFSQGEEPCQSVGESKTPGLERGRAGRKASAYLQ